MKEEILINLGNARQLERLYRSSKMSFRQAFTSLYPEVKGRGLADFWFERLNYERGEMNPAAGKELVFVLIGVIIAGFLAKLPTLFNIDKEFFYTRNIGFIIMPVLTAYFAWKHKLAMSKIAFIISTTLVAIIFLNAFPRKEGSDTLILSCIHVVLFLWAILGFAFVEEKRNQVDKRINYLSYNGDLVVITTLIVIAGGIMTGLTIGLFSMIGLNIEKFYFDNVVVFGLPAAPILGTYLIETNPELVGKVSPVIARIFSPLVLAMLVIYLVAIIYSGKDPYNDREFLLIFNALLVGVMAIIFFSVAKANQSYRSVAETWILFLLSVVTIIVNGIALSAILFRISEWGFTPNRAAVLGGNLLILINLVWVTAKLFGVVRRKEELGEVGKPIALYLPVYCIWVAIVTFVFPFIFGFR